LFSFLAVGCELALSWQPGRSAFPGFLPTETEDEIRFSLARVFFFREVARPGDPGLDSPLFAQGQKTKALMGRLNWFSTVHQLANSAHQLRAD
jgi:hypothetical protein